MTSSANNWFTEFSINFGAYVVSKRIVLGNDEYAREYYTEENGTRVFISKGAADRKTAELNQN